MNDYIDFYTESEPNVLLDEIFEIEGISRIKELSRELRTFFNYKAEVIRYRFQTNVLPNHFPNNNHTINTLHSKKQEIESISHNFISLLKSIKKNDTTLEQDIYYLHFDKNTTRLNRISTITEQISNLIHSLSEQGIHNHPKFLKFIVTLAKNVCFMKKCLKTEFYMFYDELEMNYQNLNRELAELLEGVTNLKKKKVIKCREKGLLL